MDGSETSANVWEEHRRSCWHCKREWKRWEDGDMTCETGVDLLLAARRAAELQGALW